jgi:hypothetical protein
LKQFAAKRSLKGNVTCKFHSVGIVYLNREFTQFQGRSVHARAQPPKKHAPTPQNITVTAGNNPFLRFKVKYPQIKHEPMNNVHHMTSSELCPIQQLVKYALCNAVCGVQNIPVIVICAVYSVFNPNHGYETEMLRPKYKP